MKIGILGGTFDPIHIGHIKLAEETLKKLRLDKVIFIPNYVPPHKLREGMTAWQDRYKMVELSIEGKPDFEISDIEIRRKGASYSINTIKEFKKIYGDTAEIFFITGLDSAKDLESWKDIEDVKKLCSFVIAARPGYSATPPPTDTIFIDVDTPNISSTDIRKRIKEKAPFKELVPKDAYDYIIKKRLYRGRTSIPK